METAPSGKGSRSDLPSELGFSLAPRETDPTPVVTRSSDVSRVEPTSAMVTGSRAREGHGIGSQESFGIAAGRPATNVHCYWRKAITWYKIELAGRLLGNEASNRVRRNTAPTAPAKNLLQEKPKLTAATQ